MLFWKNHYRYPINYNKCVPHLTILQELRSLSHSTMIIMAVYTKIAPKITLKENDVVKVTKFIAGYFGRGKLLGK